MRIPEQALVAACSVLSGGVEGAEDDQATRDLAERILMAVMPSIRTAERKVISAVITPARLDEMAQLAWDREAAREMQLWAQVLRSAPDSLDPVEMLVERQM